MPDLQRLLEKNHYSIKRSLFDGAIRLPSRCHGNAVTKESRKLYGCRIRLSRNKEIRKQGMRIKKINDRTTHRKKRFQLTCQVFNCVSVESDFLAEKVAVRNLTPNLLRQ